MVFMRGVGFVFVSFFCVTFIVIICPSFSFFWYLEKGDLTLKAPITTIVVCFVICLWYYVISWNSVDSEQIAP